MVDALTGHVEIAQAGGGTAAASAVIGHVTKLARQRDRHPQRRLRHPQQWRQCREGRRRPVRLQLHLGITFIDGTVFGLSSNARMVLNEMVYDPNGSNNSSLLSLVAGTITFVAGETAKHGDMKIDTPVATMGIRGTAVLVEIDFSVPGANGSPNASFQVLVEPDGTTGSYILFDKTTLQPLAIVNQAGQQININNGVISQTQNPLTPEMQNLIEEVFTQKFTDNTTTKSTTTVGSSTPDGTTASAQICGHFADTCRPFRDTTSVRGPPASQPWPERPGHPARARGTDRQRSNRLVRCRDSRQDQRHRCGPDHIQSWVLGHQSRRQADGEVRFFVIHVQGCAGPRRHGVVERRCKRPTSLRRRPLSP